jgi:MFS transporter
MDKNTQKAWRIGSFCIATYLASYVTRNILSVSTPEMIKEAFFTKEYTGLLSSICFIFYAAGQLINGFIGDRVHPKYMIIMGLGISSVSTFVIPIFDNRILHFTAFALIGFGLSMLRGPLMKVISENTAATHARMICTLFSMAGFAGPLIASILSIFFKWRAVFTATGVISVIITVLAVAAITTLEKRGEIKFVPKYDKGIAGILNVFKLEDFIFYMLISSIGEIAGSSITFWIPTYTTEHLGFSNDAASTIYSVVSFSTLFTPFITLLIYEKLIRNGIKLALVMYVISAVFFIAVRFTAAPVLNVSMLIIAKVAAAAASSIVWSAYIPGLARSGKVSSANGVIDAAGYAMASLANVLFSTFVGRLGWGGIVNMWYIIMLIGAAVSFIKLIMKKKQKA